MTQMITPGAAQWLFAWESCAGLAPAHAALRLLRTACPDADPARLAALPAGRRDALLIDLREALFGRAFACTTDCPACAQRLELEFGIDALRVPAHDAPLTDLRLEHAGYELRLRLPTALDLARIAHHDGVASARRALLEACVGEARFHGAPRSPLDLPEEVVTRLADVMAAADPQAGSAIALRCPGCGHAWEAGFDIAAYLWRELDDWARRVLLEVHALASHYGWTEPDVLALPPARRRAYLEMVGA
jgi:hypothetical protein